jgi:hypothetical protein
VDACASVTWCGRSYGTGFALGDVTLCLRCAVLDRGMLARSVATSVVVGTVLLAVNQGDLILSGAWPPSLAWKVPLTYVVPFAVSMWGALGSARRRR